MDCHALLQGMKPGSPALQADSWPPEAMSTFPPISVNKVCHRHQQLQPPKMVSWFAERELRKWKFGGSSESGKTGYWLNIRLQGKVNSDSKLELFLWLVFFVFVFFFRFCYNRALQPDSENPAPLPDCLARVLLFRTLSTCEWLQEGRN